MNIACPACKAAINAKNPKPGSYTPKCPKCALPFQLIVHDNPEQTIVVRPVAAAVAAASEQQTEKASGAMEKQAKRIVEATEVVGDRTGDYTAAPADGDDTDDRTQALTGEYNAKPDRDLDRTAPLPGDSEAADVEETTDVDRAEAKPKAKKPKQQQALPDRLGGYELAKQLGAGGMGAVYLAKQVSLDRDVALKVMHANWANDPIFLARFTREAYAAAQLNHHNVVQIFDIGADAGIHFFSMEFVEGKSLGDVLKKNGKLDPAVAVGYVIQAAKGLKYAHDRGMVHRDIKPDNLMLNVEGIVKVADLGLVKTRGMTGADDAAPEASAPKLGEASSSGLAGSKLRSVSMDVTNVGTAMGSPSYMAPEQCRDASTVDARADVYSLGCTLYAMLSGRAPFQGKTAMEVIDKHLNEAPPPLDFIDRGLPKDLCSIVARSLEKQPDNRIPSMDRFVAELRSWQERSKSGPPRPTEEQIALFENLTRQLTGRGLAKLGGTLAVVLPFVGVVAGVGLAFVKPVVGAVVLLAVPAGIAAGVVVGGLLTGSELFGKLRAWLFGARIVDWLTLVAASLLFVVGLYLAGLLVGGLAGVVLGALIGSGFAFGVTRSIAASRSASRTDFNQVLKRLRLAGMDEDAVREFVVVTAGDDAENVVDCIYGPDAKRSLRSEFEDKGESRPRYAARLDRLIAKLDDALENRKHAAARKHLERLESKRLQAEGLSAADAKSQAADAADDIVEQAAEIKAANRDKSKTVNVKAMMTRYQLAKLNAVKRPRKSPVRLLVNRVVGALLSPRLRIVVGAVLVVLGLLWVKQNATTLSAAGTVVAGAENVASAGQAKQQALGFFEVLGRTNTKPLDLGFLPELTGLVDGFNPIVAGVILILSAFTASGSAVCAMMLAAVVALVLHKFGFIPKLEPLQPSHLTAIAATLIAVVALVLFGRRGRG